MSLYTLQLKKGGFLITKEWDSVLNDYVETEIVEEDILFFSNETICLEKNLLLRDIFLFMEKYPAQVMCMSPCPFMSEVLKEGLMDPVKSEFLDNIFFLELKRTSGLNEEDGKKYMQKFIAFYGVGESGEFAVELSPINALVMFPIKLNEEVKVIEYNDLQQKEVFNYVEKFTLRELILGIVNEIGFFGSLEDKAFILESINSAVKDINEDNIETTPLDVDVFQEKLNILINENKISCKYCGADARSAHFDKPKDICFNCFKYGSDN